MASLVWLAPAGSGRCGRPELCLQGRAAPPAFITASARPVVVLAPTALFQLAGTQIGCLPVAAGTRSIRDHRD